MKLQSIQILRGFAALLVVIYHIRAMEALGIANNGLTEAPLLNGLITNGYAGVDLFFVISGFIMVHVTTGLKAGLTSSLDFLFARVTRIYPLWWFFAGVMTLAFIVYNGLGFGAGWERVSQGEPLVPYIIKSFLLAPQNAHPVLGVGWTLVHEMYFYLVFTFFMLVPRRCWLWGLLAWGAMLIAGSAAGITKPYAADVLGLIFYPMTMEFIMGAVVGLAVSAGLAWRSGMVTLVATLWLFASLGFQGVEDDNLMMWGRVVWFGLPCTLLVYGFATLELTGRQAWLVPAGVGALCAAAISLLYNLVSESPYADRLGATIMSTTIGALAMLAVLWAGWLGGQARPGAILAMQPALQRMHAGLARLGDWSFSLYLCHPLVLAPIRLGFHALDERGVLPAVFRTGHPGALDNLVLIIVSLAASIVVAWLSYRLVERPLIGGFGSLRRRLFRRSSHLNVAG
ncbi:MAG: acyltransferase family protein [Hyphomonas sp.]